MSKPPKLAPSYSTVSAEDLLDQVVSDYQIEARYSLRVYRRDLYPREAIEFEVEALSYLHQKGISVAYPIPRKSGEFLTEILAPEGPRFALLSTFADGSIPDYDEPGICHLVGESVAQMHQAADDFKTTRQRTCHDLQGLLEDSLGDLHGFNLHIFEGKVTHFDFEECGFGYRVFDLATFKRGACGGDNSSKCWSEFVAGYESIRPIGEQDLSLIDTFCIIQQLWLAAFHLRNVRDFGHHLTSDGYFDYLCGELKQMAGIEDEKS